MRQIRLLVVFILIITLFGCSYTASKDSIKTIKNIESNLTIEDCMEERRSKFLKDFPDKEYHYDSFSVRFKEGVEEIVILDLISSFNHTYRKTPRDPSLFRVYIVNSTQEASYWVCKYREYGIVNETYLEVKAFGHIANQ